MSDLTGISEEGKPLGGTELILANLKSALADLTEQVQIVMSHPEAVPLGDKPRILWLQEVPHDPACAPLRDANYRARFNRFVFCSHWQQQQYNSFLGIPFSEGIVIRNAVPLLTPSFPKPRPDGKLNFLYTSTPHRGLRILASAAAALAAQRQDWHLDIYSSLILYGWHEADRKFQALYDELRQNPCVSYHGSVSNAEVRQACLRSHVWIYPSIHPETSCMAAQEAMMAGCLAITSNLGALPETCGAWAWMFAADERFDVMVQRTLTNMLQAIENYDHSNLTAMLPLQSLYYQSFWSFEKRVPAWKQLLEEVIREGVPRS
jgi:glycosyltransferase involved in cell wall biosynthesis